jgi:hypothetical protein
LGDRSPVGLPIPQAAEFDFASANSSVPRNDRTIGNLHDKRWIIGTPIWIDEEPREAGKHGGRVKQRSEAAGDPRGANVIANMAVKFFARKP